MPVLSCVFAFELVAEAPKPPPNPVLALALAPNPVLAAGAPNGLLVLVAVLPKPPDVLPAPNNELPVLLAPKPVVAGLFSEPKPPLQS